MSGLKPMAICLPLPSTMVFIKTKKRRVAGHGGLRSKPSTLKAKAGGSPGKPGIHSETLSQAKQQQKDTDSCGLQALVSLN